MDHINVVVPAKVGIKQLTCKNAEFSYKSTENFAIFPILRCQQVQY